MRATEMHRGSLAPGAIVYHKDRGLAGRIEKERSLLISGWNCHVDVRTGSHNQLFSEVNCLARSKQSLTFHQLRAKAARSDLSISSMRSIVTPVCRQTD
jgi:hypothetical protein